MFLVSFIRHKLLFLRALATQEGWKFSEDGLYARQVEKNDADHHRVISSAEGVNDCRQEGSSDGWMDGSV